MASQGGSGKRVQPMPSRQSSREKAGLRGYVKSAYEAASSAVETVSPYFNKAVEKGQEWIWFGATTAVVVAIPVLMEIQREAMFQMEKDAVTEQQENFQKQVQEQAQKSAFGGLLGGGGSSSSEKSSS
eukprot:gb/GECG01015146.1/.p1 GENE.gb/GECG01015146.1/~~gb/GECG01015146.1/.p1  ORF type:complete len:128 (+),score=28.50 gb/GECG01015146.1/:1-384(+)